MNRKQQQTRLRTLETLESRQLLTGQGIALPIASFNPPVEQQLMPTTQGQIALAEMADLNQDGLRDYAAALRTSTGSHEVAFFIASGNEFRKANADSLNGQFFVDIEKGDIDGDGWTDIVVASDKKVHTYLNQGLSEQGAWLGMQPHQEINLATTSIKLADLNDDGRDDLIMGTEKRVDVRFADGNASFTSGIWYAQGPGKKLVAAGDVNRDGNVDIVVGLSESQSALVLLNDGDGFMAEGQSIGNVKPSRTLALLDIDADQNLDLIVGGENQEEENVFIWSGAANGQFAEEATGFETVGAPLNFAIGDVNGDGNNDLVVGHDGTFHHPITNNGPGGISVLLADSNAALQAPIRIFSPGASSLTVAENDGGTEIIAVQQWNNTVSKFFWSDRQLVGTAVDFADDLANPFGRRQSVFGDFNADGVTDAVVADQWTENAEAHVYIGKDDGTFDKQSLATAANLIVSDLFIGDFNGDGRDDLGMKTQLGQTHAFSSRISNGDGTFAADRTSILPQTFVHLQTRDVNGDGRDDLVGTEVDGKFTSIVTATANVDGSWTSGDKLRLENPFVDKLVVRDLNGDGHLDAAATSFQGVEVVWGTAAKTFDRSTTPNIETNYHAVGDFNGDGFADVAGGGFGELSLTIGFGSAGDEFEIVSDVSISQKLSNAQGLQAIDVDGDGTDEIVILSNDSFYILESDGVGGFSATEHTIGFFPSRLIQMEVTGDSLADLIVSPGGNFISGSPTTNIAILPGTADGGFAPSIVASVSMIDGAISQIKQRGGTIEYFISHRVGFGRLIGTIADLLPGDFDGDGQINPDDIDLLCAASLHDDLPVGEVARFDQNADGVIDDNDVDSWLLEIAKTKRGDSDLDGDVDFADFLALSSRFGSTDASWSDGDFDCDGSVGFSDFLLLSLNFGK